MLYRLKDPIKCTYYQGKIIPITRKMPDVLISWLNRFFSSAINKARREKGEPLNDQEKAAVAIVLGRAHSKDQNVTPVWFEWEWDAAGGMLVVKLERPVMVEIIGRMFLVRVVDGKELTFDTGTSVVQ
jgi:hypothetical protein